MSLSSLLLSLSCWIEKVSFRGGGAAPVKGREERQVRGLFSSQL